MDQFCGGSGIEDFMNASNPRIYPNPGTGLLNLDMDLSGNNLMHRVLVKE
jgi:hypothetical protein